MRVTHFLCFALICTVSVLSQWLTALNCSYQTYQLIRQRYRLYLSRNRTTQSSCLLSRLGHFSPGAKEAAKRRASAKYRDELNQQDQRAHYQAHIRMLIRATNYLSC